MKPDLLKCVTLTTWKPLEGNDFLCLILYVSN